MTADICATEKVPAFTGTQTLDGNGDEFCDVAPFELNFSNGATGNNENLSQKLIARIAWSSTHFVAFIEVTDSELATKESIDELWGGDNVEMFLAPDASALNGHFGGMSDGVQLSFAPPTDALPARAVRLFWDGSGNQAREELTSGFKTVKTDAGYAIELQLPWTLFGTPPAATAGNSIGFDMALSTANTANINSAQDAREGSVLMHLGAPKNGVDSCGDGDEAPWCNSTTWCSSVLQ